MHLSTAMHTDLACIPQAHNSTDIPELEPRRGVLWLLTSSTILEAMTLAIKDDGVAQRFVTELYR